jgi:hypothetical protein
MSTLYGCAAVAMYMTYAMVSKSSEVNSNESMTKE